MIKLVPSMKLSKYFTLEEMVQSQTATRRGLDNTPPEDIKTNLALTCNLADEVRELLGAPILVSSGYRSPAVNAAVGGSQRSAHMRGYAIDFICPGFGTPEAIVNAVYKSKIDFDQIIMEGTWVHLSFAPTMRREALTKVGNGLQPLGI